jgi:hypothetical protein
VEEINAHAIWIRQSTKSEKKKIRKKLLIITFIHRKGDNIVKRHESCATCGFLVWGNIHNNIAYDTYYYCEINKKEIEYPRKMGGRNKCPCYMDKAEYRKENKRKTIENHVYPKAWLNKEVGEDSESNEILHQVSSTETA